jgi:hypothetical protein
MLRSVAITRIKRGLDFRTVGDSDIANQLQESQRLLEKGKDLPRFLIQEDENFAVTSGSAEIALPTGFLREVEDSSFQYYDTEGGEWVTLEKMSINEAKTRFGEAEPGQPQAYVLRNETVAIYPERDTSYTLVWSYYKAADVLDTDIENAWLEFNPEALIGHAGMMYARDLGNAAAVQRFQALYNEAWANQFAEDVERERDNDPIHMGGRL